MGHGGGVPTDKLDNVVESPGKVHPKSIPIAIAVKIHIVK